MGGVPFWGFLEKNYTIFFLGGGGGKILGTPYLGKYPHGCRVEELLAGRSKSLNSLLLVSSE